MASSMFPEIDLHASHDQAKRWKCWHCTFRNEPDVTACEMCELVRDTSKEDWSCGVCTFVNRANIKKCSICSADKPPPQPVATPPVVSVASDEHKAQDNNSNQDNDEKMSSEPGDVEVPDDDDWGDAPDLVHQFSQESAASWGDFEEEQDITAPSNDVIAEVKKRVEADLVELRQIPHYNAAPADWMGGSSIRLKLSLDLAHLNLSAEQLTAWSFDPNQPLIIQLDFSRYYFESAERPEVTKVGQAAGFLKAVRDTRLSWTLKSRLTETFLPSLPSKLEPAGYSPSSVRELMDMSGASYLPAYFALQESKNDMHAACAVLLDKTKKNEFMKKLSKMTTSHVAEMKSKSDDVDKLSKMMKVSKEVAALALQLEGSLQEATILLSNDAAKVQLAAIASEEKRSWKARVMDIGLAKILGKHNYLIRLMDFVEDKLKTINSSCLICDRVLGLQGLKPTVCERDVCVMGYEEMGLGFSLEDELKQSPEVTDLLISLLVASIDQGRLLWVTPVNVTGRDKNGKELSFGHDKDHLDTSLIRSVLQDNCPSVAEMSEVAANPKMSLISWLNSRHPLLYPLLRWIITTNRAHLRKLKNSEMISEVNTPHQFVLLTNSPAKERKWRTLKRARRGSLWAFHGSGTGNWHSILRTGLKNLSNTKYMTSGAARGPGIYMATQAQTSLGYCSSRGGWNQSMYGSSFICMAICEVIDTGNLRPPVYVVPNEDEVTTRFLLIYPANGNQYPNNSADLTKINVPRIV